jgi:hypothetical protein
MVAWLVCLYCPDLSSTVVSFRTSQYSILRFVVEIGASAHVARSWLDELVVVVVVVVVARRS